MPCPKDLQRYGPGEGPCESPLVPPHRQYQLTSNFRNVLFQVDVGVLQVVGVDVDLDELEEAEMVDEIVDLNVNHPGAAVIICLVY